MKIMHHAIKIILFFIFPPPIHLMNSAGARYKSNISHRHGLGGESESPADNDLLCLHTMEKLAMNGRQTSGHALTFNFIICSSPK